MQDPNVGRPQRQVVSCLTACVVCALPAGRAAPGLDSRLAPPLQLLSAHLPARLPFSPTPPPPAPSPPHPPTHTPQPQPPSYAAPARTSPLVPRTRLSPLASGCPPVSLPPTCARAASPQSSTTRTRSASPQTTTLSMLRWAADSSGGLGQVVGQLGGASAGVQQPCCTPAARVCLHCALRRRSSQPGFLAGRPALPLHANRAAKLECSASFSCCLPPGELRTDAAGCARVPHLWTRPAAAPAHSHGISGPGASDWGHHHPGPRWLGSHLHAAGRGAGPAGGAGAFPGCQIGRASDRLLVSWNPPSRPGGAWGACICAAACLGGELEGCRGARALCPLPYLSF